MRVYAYTRVSTLDQSTDMQHAAIKAKYPDAIFWEEKTSGTTRKGRVQLEGALKSIQEGDKLVVWKLDRLARDLNDLTNIVKELETKGAALEILDQAIDTSTAAGKAFLQMLGVFAEFETNLRKERQLEGIKNAKEAGKHLGRKPSLTDEQKQAIKGEREALNPTQLAKKYGVSRATIYNVLNG
ncbi:recombinase family protein [Desulfoluna spongiiphila]|uniref:Site-specific DNA recombinase n=1 Tax=Desulfoluna spongiiphila TaxID=419481 RepID=A0A1G5ADR9_9BACT|nr:recombinase family protein [Desulfoluna spongiiphila]SCX76014.1 Site-specific DNA recombinase [Desulfoluna spongiiphila]